MKVLEIISRPLRANGQTLFVVRFTERMQKVETDYLSFGEIAPEVRARIKGTIYTAPDRLKEPLRYIAFVRDTVRNNGYSVVHIHGNSRTLAIELLGALLGGAKVRITHCHNTQGKYPKLHKLMKPLFELLVTHRFACGREAGQWLYGKKPFRVIPNAVDTKLYAYDPAVRAEMRSALNLGENTLVLGNISRFVPEKNHRQLLEIFKEILTVHPDCILLLAGNGSRLNEIKQLSETLGLSEHVRFLGHRDDVPRLLQAMDIMLLPSLFEGFPTVVLEWQAAGLITLLSENVTPDCVLTDFTKRLPLDTKQWVDAVLSSDISHRTVNAAQGTKALVERGYDLEAEALKLEQTYIELSEAAAKH